MLQEELRGLTPPARLSTLPARLRLGLRMIHGLAESVGKLVEQVRGEGGPFRSMEDFTRRTRLGRGAISRLAKAGAFGSLTPSRRAALWDSLGQDARALPLFDEREAAAPQQPPLPRQIALPQLSPSEEVLADYRTLGLSLRAHPLSFFREDLKAQGVASAEDLKTWPNDRPVAVAGIVLVRQRPGTAKGITFMTLEDETGTANLIVRPHVWRRYRAAAMGAVVMLARGKLQRHASVIHVLATQIENLSARWNGLDSQSRDFC